MMLKAFNDKSNTTGFFFSGNGATKTRRVEAKGTPDDRENRSNRWSQRFLG
jgi:hypothetical protein